MVNVSKRQIKRKVLLAISNNLFGHIVGIHTSVDADKFLSALLTSSERIMLAKRFAVIFMLERGWSSVVIAKTLKMSPTTILKIDDDREEGIYDFILERIPKKHTNTAKSSDFWVDLDKFLRVGGIMPPRGRGRWRDFYKITDKISAKKVLP
jgi:uncharacterized protein YerC